jgi:hypothetical protein
MSGGFDLAGCIETLESRTLLATTPQISFNDFSSTTGLVGNGFGGSVINAGSALRLTDGQVHESRSLWSSTRVPINKFTSHFSFQINSGFDLADGLTFTVQNGPTTTLGIEGNRLGYGGITQSVAVAFNTFNFNAFGSKFGFAQNGEFPVTDTDPAPIDLHSGHIFDATVEYDGTTLSVSLTDHSNPSATFNASTQIDIPAIIGSDDAIVGFTASTGDHFSTQDILSWDFTGEPAVNANDPTITAAASATPVTGKFTNLSVLASDPGGEQNLTYTWTTIKKPPGAKEVIFSDNGTNAAKGITGRFSKDGTFRFRVTVTNQSGGSVISEVSVVVHQTPADLRITPHKEHVARGDTLRFRGVVLDQFNHAMRTQPTVTWAMQSGPGTIAANSGLFTAPSNRDGHFVIHGQTVNDIDGVSANLVT